MLPEQAYRVNLFATLLLVTLACSLGGCAGPRFENGVLRKGGLQYTIGSPPAGFRKVALSGNDLAFLSTDSPHSIAVNASCAEHGDPPLQTLISHLLMGFTDRETLEESLGTLDGREALRAHYRAKLDGVPFELLLVVTKKNGCVYDFTYCSPPGRLEEHLAPFETLLANFRTGDL